MSSFTLVLFQNLYILQACSLQHNHQQYYENFTAHGIYSCPRRLLSHVASWGTHALMMGAWVFGSWGRATEMANEYKWEMDLGVFMEEVVKSNEYKLGQGIAKMCRVYCPRRRTDQSFRKAYHTTCQVQYITDLCILRQTEVYIESSRTFTCAHSYMM